MPTQETLPDLHYQNLRVGRSRIVPGNRPMPNRTQLEAAIRRSEELSHFYLVDGTRYQVGAWTNTEQDGNFSFWVASGFDFEGERVPACTTLYSAAVACCEATAPIAWRGIMQQYLSMMLDGKLEDRYHAPGPMPRRFPWVCAFPNAPCFALKREAWVEVTNLVEACARILAVRGLRALAREEAEGRGPKVDPELFLELRDWSD